MSGLEIVRWIEQMRLISGDIWLMVASSDVELRGVHPRIYF